METEKTSPLIVVSEKIIKESAEECGGIQNTFQRVLDKGTQMRMLGAEPVYLYDEINGVIEVKTAHKHNGRMN